jgi:hypothetical protein
MNALTYDTFSHQDYLSIFHETWNRCEELGKLKGGEYAGDYDRLANFRRAAANIDLPMEVIWYVYCSKHWDAITQYVKDITTNTERTRLEPIEGRIDDIIVYMILLKCMVRERSTS